MYGEAPGVIRDLLYERDEHLKRGAEFPAFRGYRDDLFEGTGVVKDALAGWVLS